MVTIKSPLRIFIEVSMKELIRGFRRQRIRWRNAFLLGSIMTTIVILLHTPTFSIFSDDEETESSYSSPIYLNGSLHLNIQIVSEAKVENFPSLTTSPVVKTNSSSEFKRVDGETNLPRKRQKRKGRKKTKDDLILTDPPPAPRHVLSSLERRALSLPPKEALAFAKLEIQRAPEVENDTELFAPVFRNLSIFKRSYELMELILKVHIYPDGEKPIFHQPHLNGIYASEGWFMKLMESNTQFVTKNPEKAHLFYMPYSVKQLQHAIFVPGSHNIKPLSIFIRDYVNMLSIKYPFWNRTHGSDHFLVACHDWGPYTVNEHPELRQNTIKALCNADLSDGIFVPGRDVSLPETSIRNAGRPLRNIGNGNRVSQRPILAFFAGNLHGRVRPQLLKHWRNKDGDMKIYGPLPHNVARKMTYVQHMKSSKYCLCPMGYEVNSPRIVEAIYYECVPVIIADNFVLPFSEVLDWSAFSVVVPEKDIPRLKEILLEIPMRRYLKMQSNVKMVQKHFLWSPKPRRYDVFHMILHSIWSNLLHQNQTSNHVPSFRQHP
ncbi:PREDICTED: probable glycosyltransferase At5g03795 [Brassica oleracea var. oleracea]|uniref:Exostosin GT47 domain-containing protein n=1 Tax=Brassica oleracea var. oleracea TaxID=109376 RepID=A0A0D3A7H9_BRAOL|nr:PREDICTED: probable glycosyltransferase At5g03795 [Brassica oleracea var. oleracea]XP_013620165.1 PREDICTED: probable glycosyltransferase At5g03795 [Brassica oleracea var. oleracea]